LKAPHKILVLNNDSAFLDLMKQVLGDDGYEVVVRKVWDDAYGVVKRERPDLIILDVLLDSAGKGFELVDLLTLDPQTRSTPIVIASTNTAQLRERIDAFTTMGIPLIGKPFDLDTLMNTIQRALAAGTREGAHAVGLGGPVEGHAVSDANGETETDRQRDEQRG
jgi:CheY-like chemotaxis protein